MITADIIKNIRHLSGLSPQELADLCGYSAGYIQALESNKVPINAKFELVFYVRVLSNSRIEGNLQKIFSEIENLKKKFSV